MCQGMASVFSAEDVCARVVGGKGKVQIRGSTAVRFHARMLPLLADLAAWRVIGLFEFCSTLPIACATSR